MQFEHFIESLEGLQSELRRNMTLLADLDDRSHSLHLSVERDSERYSRETRDMNVTQRRSALQHIDSQMARMREFADDKVQLSIQTYELVDKHVRRLDADLARFQADLRQRGVIGAVPAVAANGSRRRGAASTGSSQQPTAGTTAADASKGTTASRKRSRQTDKSGKASSASAGSSQAAGSSHLDDVALSSALAAQQSDVLDMPVDPNEPTYCLCNQVSYGEMIGCDNLDCPIEWFHFACVGLVDKPKGKWFCPSCGDANDKKK